MKQYKVWQAPLWAFFSTHFYRDLGSHGKGVGFVYLLCLLVFSCGIESIKTAMHFHRKIEVLGPYYAQQIPDMEVQNGKLKMDKESVYYIFDPETQEPVIAFDCTADTKNSPQELGVAVLVTEKNVLAKMGTESQGKASEILSFSAMNGMKMNKDSFMQTIRMCSLGVPFVDIALRLPPAWAWSIFQALAYSLVGLVLAKMISVNIKYEGILRVASFAVGNAIIIGIVAKFFPSEIAGVSLTNFGVHLGFLQLLTSFVFTLFGVSANLSTPTFVSSEAAAETE